MGRKLRGRLIIRPEYRATLKSFVVGEIRQYPIESTLLSGFRVAKSRLKQQGYDFEITPNYEVNIFTVQRVS